MTLLVDAIGVLAGLCSMASFVPQIVKIAQERDASNVSLRMFAVSATAFTLWTIYGWLHQSWPLIGANLICLMLVIAIIGLRLRFGGRARSST
ncbi:MAG TPA: SemiSWEET family transporter [Terricaulis sp.]|nr:SemiSWEET family transporter [Terricaulis sp.]